MSVIRPTELSDIPKTFRVRTATDENRLTLAELAALGINENSVKEKLLSSYKGWLCEEKDSVVGFAIGDRSSGEMWVIAVHSHSCSPGSGGALLEQVETWLSASPANCLYRRSQERSPRTRLLSIRFLNVADSFGIFIALWHDYNCAMKRPRLVSVDVVRSTGHDVLDGAATSALRRWKFPSGGSHVIRIPLSFTIGGVRHRMSGAVISD